MKKINNKININYMRVESLYMFSTVVSLAPSIVSGKNDTLKNICEKNMGIE